MNALLRSGFRLAVLFFAISFSGSAHATNLWEQNTATIGFDEKWGTFLEFQPRWIDRFSDEQLLNIRGALLYRVSPELRLGVGAGWMPQYRPFDRDEKRIFQQVEYWKTGSDWVPSFRGRFEQRFLEFTNGALWRVRAKGQITWMPSDFGAYAWDEFFLHLNGKSNQVLSGFDQNRFSIGPRGKWNWLTVEAGYLLQTFRNSKGVTKSDHGAVLSLAANFW